MVTKGKEMVAAPSDEALAQLRQEYPTEIGFKRALLPRFALVSQDVTEGKGKAMKVIAEAGTFYIEVQSEEEEEVEVDGKMVMRKKWERTELGKEAEGIILYQRKQLKYYDEAEEKYTSSPVYDTEDEVLPLFKDKQEVARGTPAELRKLYPGVSRAGKAKSNLEDNRILYVLLKNKETEEDAIFQLNLRGTSMYSFLTFARKTLPPSVLTKFSSEPQEKGSTEWNMMTFEPVRPLNKKEVDDVLEKVNEIKQGIAEEKSYYAAANAASESADKEFEAK